MVFGICIGIILETKIISMLYLFNQMMLPFHFSSTMFVRKNIENFYHCYQFKL